MSTRSRLPGIGVPARGSGRAYLWGLASFGEAGVEAVLALLRKELQTAMRHMGTPTLGDIHAAHVRDLRAAATPPAPG